MAPRALRSSCVADEPQPMCTTSRVDGARKSSACHSVRLIEHAESDEASETASGAGASPAKRCGGAAQASARAKACMWKSIVRLAHAELQPRQCRRRQPELRIVGGSNEPTKSPLQRKVYNEETQQTHPAMGASSVVLPPRPAQAVQKER